MSGPVTAVILVYNADSGIAALLLDVLKKAAGREDCSLCEITYSAVGKRRAWKACESRLGVRVEELHRDQLPAAWGVGAGELPCILARSGDERPFVLVSRSEIDACQRDVGALERRLVAALAAGAPARVGQS